MNTPSIRNGYTKYTALGMVALAMLGLSPLLAQVAAPDATTPASDKPEDKTLQLQTVVVTGVFQGTKKEEATVAISTMNSREIEHLVPVSAADLLSNVPGVFVDSSHGEIRNVVYSRGVSANSLDGASGYFYVAMEEDGLPVANASWVNFGPDYFLRADATLDRLEAVRGGAAAITGPNAPGGIFNYISKQGTDVATGQVSARFGLEGDGQNPYYRTDLWLGGPLGKGWNYSVGGFYRRADGSQNPGFPMNKGGQIKLNLTRKIDGGMIQFYGKYLNDINGFANFIPAVNFKDPQPAPGWNLSSNPTPPRTVFDYQVGPSEMVHFDSSNQQKNTSKVIGFKFEKQFGDGWSVNNNMKYSDSLVVWNTWIGILPQALTDYFTPIFYGQFGTLGTFTYKDPTGTRTAHINQYDYLSASVIDSNLPLNNLMPASGFASIALDFRPGLKEYMDQISISKKLEHMTFTLGAFLSFSDATSSTRTPGLSLSTLEPDPRQLNLTVQPTGGGNLQVTNPAGVGAIVGNTNQSASWDQISVFFGHRWDLTPDWTFDWGARAESIDVSVTSPTLTGNPGAVVSTTGGLDGNPNTIYDNSYVPAPTSFFTFDRRITNQSFTAALFRKLSKRQSLYLRYSNGAKAPDLGIFFAQNDPAAVKFANTSSQKIQQVELGYRYNRPGLSLVVTPYYSLLDNVQTTQLFTDATTATFYPRISANALESYGVELESTWIVTNEFALNAALTWQKSTATKRFNWVQGATPAGDVLVDLSGGKADNSPDIMATITPSYTKGRFYAQAQWRYMGDRPANAENAFTLPAFNTTNLTASWRATRQITLSLTINNAFNQLGVYGFTIPATNLVSALNRQAITAAQIQANPNALFTIIPAQGRAYFLEATYKF